MAILVNVLVVIGLIIINYEAIKNIKRLISIKKHKASVEGKIIDFDGRNAVTVEYNVDGIEYKEKCGVMFTRPFSSNIMDGDNIIKYANGDIVNVDFDSKNPKCFLINGGSTFYKFRISLILFLDIGVLFISSICFYMLHLTEIGIL